MTDSNNAKTMYETIPAAAELNKVPGFDPLKFLRRAGNSMKLDLPYQKLWFRMAHPNGRQCGSLTRWRFSRPRYSWTAAMRSRSA